MDGMKMFTRSVSRRAKARRAAAALFIAVTAMLLALSSCSDALLNEMNRLATEANQPGIEPPINSLITAHEFLTLTFGSSAEGAAVAFSGNIWLGPAQAPLSVGPDKTLVLNTGGTAVKWASGTGKTLTLSVTSGGQTVTYSYSFDVFNGSYVAKHDRHGTLMSDSNPGTFAAPKVTIQAGIAIAVSLYSPNASNPVTVKVGEGTYSSAYNGGTGSVVVEMVEGVSIYGGYADGNRSLRDPSTKITTIQDSTSTAAGSTSLTAPNRAIRAAAGITRATIIDGVTITAGTAGNFGAGLLCDVGSPTVRACTINGMATSGASQSFGVLCINAASPEIIGSTINGGEKNTSAGVYSVSSTPSIHDSTVTGGIAPGISYGIYSSSSGSKIYNCSVFASTTAFYAYGIYANGTAGVEIYNCLISGGTGNTGGTGGTGGTNGSAYGIYCNGAAPIIKNNTIDCGNLSIRGTADPACIYLSNSASAAPYIENNILFARNSSVGYGVYEAGTSGDPATIKNNDFVTILSGALYFDEGTTAVTSIATINLMSGASANQNADPAFANTTNYDWHLTVSTPAAVKSGGLDLSTETDFPSGAGGTKVDRSGSTIRTVPWSIGAYELD